MGLSVSAASAVFAIGFVMVAIILVDGLTHSYQEMDDATGDRTEREREILDTAITMDTARHYNSTQTLQLNVTNTGSATLDPEELDVVADGMLVTGNITSMEVDGSPAGAWFPEKTLVIELTVPEPPGRVRLVTGNGVAEYTTDITPLP